MSLLRYQQFCIPSRLNNTTTVLASGVSFIGEPELNVFTDVGVSCKTSHTGKLYFDFSNDKDNWDTFPSSGFDITANIHEFHTAIKLYRWFRVRFTNTSASTLTYLRLYVYYGNLRQPNAPLNSSVSSDSDSIITRSVLMGETESGEYKYVPVTGEGHLEVAIHEPLLPFGSLHTEKLTPIFQTDAVYGLNSGQVASVSSGSGSVSASNGMFVLTSGTTIYSQGVLLGRKRLRYRSGQGVIGRFTTKFTSPVANSYQLIGFGHAESGIYVGYGDTNDLTDLRLGILHVKDGVREVKTLTVTTGATANGNVTVTLNGTAFTVAVTNASNIQRTVWEISQGTFTGWDAYPNGATVVFIRKSAGTTAGTQSFGAAATGAVATIAQTKVGVASTDKFYPQDEWNGDKLDGTGPSGVTINPVKLNIWQVFIGYLGTDDTVIQAKVSLPGNNSVWVTTNIIKFTNSLDTPNYSNPSFPFTMAVYSAGSTTDLTVKCGSFAGFIEGGKHLHGNRFTYYNQSTTVTDSAFKALFTIMNARVYANRSNQAVINILAVMGALKHTSPCIFYLIKGGALAGNPNFQSLASNSCSLWDTAATTVTYSTGDQLLWTGHLGDTGELDHHFGNGEFNAEEVTLQPGEWITLAAKAVTGTPAYVTGSINTREDQ